MNRLVVAVAVLVSFLCVAGRTIPRVVTGISFFTVLQAVAFLAILVVLFRRRREIGTYFRRDRLGRHVTALATLGMLGLLLLLFMGARGETEAGRVWNRVAPDLDRDEPEAALDLARHLRRVESGPLKVRILDRIAELEPDEAEVVESLLAELRESSDREVRSKISEVLAPLLTDREAIDLVAGLPAEAPGDAELLARALRERTGASHGPDAGAWRDWIARDLISTEGERGYAAATDALRALGEFPVVRAAALSRIRTGDGADRMDLRKRIEADRADERSAAAAALAKAGEPTDVFPLARRMKTEDDPAAAGEQARAILALDPDRGRKLLEDVSRTARNEDVRGIAAAALR
jgi:hypothetical protein